MRSLVTGLGLGVAVLAAAAGGAPAAKPPGKRARPAAKAAPRLIGKMAFTPAELDLAPGEQYPVDLFVPSPTGKRFEGALSFKPEAGVTVKPDERWTGKIPPWGVKTFPVIAAAADAKGKIPVEAALEKGGRATLAVNVVELPVEVLPGARKLTVKVGNPFRTRLLTGRVQASNRDRFLEDVTALEFKVPPGQTGEVVFPLPGAAPAEGEKYDFTLTVETYQGYHQQKTYSLSFPPQEGKG
jgi:hypothetical protein